MNVQLILIKALQFFCCISLLVVLHEGGHFGFSKLFGVKVEKFFMFFDYKFHLFSTKSKWFTKLFPKFKDMETEYGIGWIPFGGYVKIAGMVDESMDTEQLKQPKQPNEFRSQAVWKRLLIMLGGVMMNIITAFVIYCAVLFTWGQDVLPIRTITNGFAFNEAAEQVGFRDGDIPVKIDGNDIDGYNMNILRDISNASTVTVLRGTEEVTLQMPAEKLNMLEMLEMQPAFMTIAQPALIDSVMTDSPAGMAGVVKGSYILSANGADITYWSDYDSLALCRDDILSSETCTKEDSLQQRNLTLVVLTPQGTRDTLSFVMTEDYMMGVARHNYLADYNIEHRTYNAITCVPAGIKYGWNTLVGYVNDLKYVPTKKGAQSLGSFITIGSIFPDQWNWQGFWMITAFISIILAVMNILPIPGLDGGHVVLLMYEAIVGREPNEKVMEWIERIGIGLLILLMVLALGNDINRFLL